MSNVTDRLRGVKSSMAIKVPCRVATTANITLSGEQTIDGVAVTGAVGSTAADRVLVKNQTTASENGIYDVSTGAWRRAADWDGVGDIVRGTQVYVTSGTQAGRYVVRTADPIVIGTTSVTIGATDEVTISAVGDGVTDDTAAFTAAFAAVSDTGGGRVYVDRRSGPYLIDSNLTIPDNVELIGPFNTPGEILPAGGEDFSAYAGAIVLNSSATISVGDSAGIEGCLIIRKGLSLPFASHAAAETGIAAFAGTAITFAGGDAAARYNFIIGFNKAIVSSGHIRPTVEWNFGDCLSGVEVTGSYDVGRINFNHFWPFTTANQSWSDWDLVPRSGIGFHIHDVADGHLVTHNFAYGYATNFHLEDIALARVTNNVSDHAVSQINAISGFESYTANGLVTAGVCNSIDISSLHANNTTYNLRLTHTSGAVVAGSIDLGLAAESQIYVGAGSGFSCGVAAIGGASDTACIEFASGVGKVTIGAVHLHTNTKSGNAYSIATADLANVHIGQTILDGVSTTDNIGMRRVLNGTNVFTVQTRNNTQTRDVLYVEGHRGTGQNSDSVAALFRTSDAAGTMTGVARLKAFLSDATGGATNGGQFRFGFNGSGTVTDRLVATYDTVAPLTDNTMTLGLLSLRYAGAFLMALNLSAGSAPANASDTGTAGEIRQDGNHIYICTATNTWKRVAIATWP